VKDVRSFFENTGFYSRFIQKFSKIVKALSSPLAKDVHFHFSKECLEAFIKLKEVSTTTAIYTLLSGTSLWNKYVMLLIMLLGLFQDSTLIRNLM